MAGNKFDSIKARPFSAGLLAGYRKNNRLISLISAKKIMKILVRMKCNLIRSKLPLIKTM